MRIDPGTFRLAEQRLNRYAPPGPHLPTDWIYIFHDSHNTQPLFLFLMEANCVLCEIQTNFYIWYEFILVFKWLMTQI